jgi:hypothetical protein
LSRLETQAEPWSIQIAREHWRDERQYEANLEIGER